MYMRKVYMYILSKKWGRSNDSPTLKACYTYVSVLKITLSTSIHNAKVCWEIRNGMH